ncbi:hypothetical protein PanWU01x14_155970, partial [Parasponia andersonii]
KKRFPKKLLTLKRYGNYNGSKSIIGQGSAKWCMDIDPIEKDYETKQRRIEVETDSEMVNSASLVAQECLALCHFLQRHSTSLDFFVQNQIC